MNNFECKIYCGLLKIKFEEFNELSLKQQIDLVENLNSEKINSSSVLKDAKEKLLGILYQEREEDRKFDREQRELEKMLDNNPRRYKGGENRE